MCIFVERYSFVLERRTQMPQSRYPPGAGRQAEGFLFVNCHWTGSFLHASRGPLASVRFSSSYCAADACICRTPCPAWCLRNTARRVHYSSNV